MANKMSIKGLFDRMSGTEVAGLPAGQVVLVGSFIGISRAVITALIGLIGKENARKLKVGPVSLLPVAAGAGLAYGLNRFPQGKAFLGTTGTKAAEFGALYVGLDEGTHMTAYTRYAIARLFDLAGADKPWDIAGMSKFNYVLISGTEDKHSLKIPPSVTKEDALKAEGLSGIGMTATPPPLNLSAATPAPGRTWERAPEVSGPAPLGAVASQDIDSLTNLVRNIRKPVLS